MRPARTSVLIVCEGSETEPLYLAHIKKERSQTVEIKVDPRQNAANMLSRIERLRRVRGYDHIWCVLDHDGRSGIERTLNEVMQFHQVAFSNPCAEIWYYWHFDDKGPCTKDEIQRILKRKIPRYHKSMDIYDRLLPLQDVARRRAQDWRRRHKEVSKSEFENPSTGMDQLVGFLTDL